VSIPGEHGEKMKCQEQAASLAEAVCALQNDYGCQLYFPEGTHDCVVTLDSPVDPGCSVH
jgi:hypothetical protein